MPPILVMPGLDPGIPETTTSIAICGGQMAGPGPTMAIHTEKGRE
jgi:hypothetical protein